MKARDLIYWLAILVLLNLLFRGCGTKQRVTVTRFTDTVYVRDTIREPVPEPYAVYIARVDTVKVFVPLPASRDTVELPVVVPIEEKQYRTDSYLAVVRGYRPELVRLDLFPETAIIHNTEIQRIKQKTRFGVGIQAGYGYNGQGLRPYIGIGLQYNLWSF